MAMLWYFKMLQAVLIAANFPPSSPFSLGLRLFRATGFLIIYTYPLQYENWEDTNTHSAHGI